jgi:hypothetical protein
MTSWPFELKWTIVACRGMRVSLSRLTLRLKELVAQWASGVRRQGVHPAISDALEPEAEPAPIRETELPAGERRQLTVLFCDLVGSTEIASRLDAARVQAAAEPTQFSSYCDGSAHDAPPTRTFTGTSIATTVRPAFFLPEPRDAGSDVSNRS